MSESVGSELSDIWVAGNFEIFIDEVSVANEDIYVYQESYGKTRTAVLQIADNQQRSDVESGAGGTVICNTNSCDYSDGGMFYQSVWTILPNKTEHITSPSGEKSILYYLEDFWINKLKKTKINFAPDSDEAGPALKEVFDSLKVPGWSFVFKKDHKPFKDVIPSKCFSLGLFRKLRRGT